MGRTKRKYNAELIRFQKTLRKPIRNVLAIMPKGFTDKEFLCEFKLLYSYLWDVCAKAKEYRRMDNGLEKKSFPKRYFFPTPAIYIKKVSPPIIKNKALHEKLILYSEERTNFRNSLIKECAIKRQKREVKLETNLKYTQKVTPSYSNYYIQTYFHCKRTNPIDVDTRYAVLVEASKYKSPITIKFLHRVNASERNYHLRYFAFQALQKFGVKEVRLRKNRKGKKKVGDKILPTPIETPDDLIHSIYNSQLEQMKKYDLFLSHSSFDSELLLSLKSVLNHSNVNVYVDWVSDRNALKRELTNINTANTIIERLKSSKALLYIHTQASQNSKWTPWELGFFHALKGKICIYNPDNIEKAPYLDIYPIVVLEEGKLFVETGEGRVLIKQWIDE